MAVSRYASVRKKMHLIHADDFDLEASEIPALREGQVLEL